MHSFTLPAAALAALAALPAVSAHGYVSGVVAGGKWYPGASPQWIYDNPKPQQAGWFAYNQDNGFVAPAEYGDQNITCHKGATPGTTSITVAAGSTIDLQWNTWPSSHHGPVIDYLARCTGDCTKQDKSKLTFFKVDALGLTDDSAPPGLWGTDKLIANNNTWTMKIPSGLSGNFVLRHEIIALHSAGNSDGAQNYTNCLNLIITGTGTERPCDNGADCRLGPALYKETGAGILVNIYVAISSYSMPGPAVWSGLKRRAMAFIA
ncbi:hypothetical protein LTS16_024166 [Friedmanniomyces endolithicus]|nr:hypothetical protein LTR94_018823 [Friedmanniomyces endolithicus]KAK0779010.1 hypothetical protein LTR75_015485 [Friedmanniomyces endolithicus]KAK0792979.1 hypothetical protein LTR59_008351 [Friedmanniomyces endolithicus]KAK0853488.1 hypothetical protein LTS02_011918 [Friedmanniomyces endolithicus]KAK0865360.1 hypothetical protein LTR87_015448 [Friedmanniomyces endolithicus]